jgi:hypothetical protein
MIEQGIGAYHQSQLLCEPRSRFTTQPEGDGSEHFLQAVGFPGARSDLRQPLAEDGPFAGALVAEELAGPDLKLHSDSSPGQI